MNIKTLVAAASVVVVGSLSSNVSNAADAAVNFNVTGSGTPSDPTRMTGSASASTQVGPVTLTGSAGATYNPANGQSSPQAGFSVTWPPKK